MPRGVEVKISEKKYLNNYSYRVIMYRMEFCSVLRTVSDYVSHGILASSQDHEREHPSMYHTVPVPW
jgi:hypothetical protein